MARESTDVLVWYLWYMLYMDCVTIQSTREHALIRISRPWGPCVVEPCLPVWSTYSLYLFTPLQTEANSISVVWRLCFGWVSAFVSTSAVCSRSQQLSAQITPYWIKSQIQCHFVAMCLEHLWNCGFHTIANASKLSPINAVGIFWGNPSSSLKFLSQHASHPASDSATYSASVNDKATTVCFFDHQVIVPPAAKKTYSDVDLRSLQLA